MPTWEILEGDATNEFGSYTARMKVPGGWLYRWSMNHALGVDSAMVFVPVAQLDLIDAVREQTVEMQKFRRDMVR